MIRAVPLRESGVTLVELMVVIAMLAIVLAIGIPAYQNFTTSNTLLAELHTLKGDIALARSEAATTGSNVLICPSTNPDSAAPTCGGSTEWNTGWIIVPADSNCSAALTNAAPLKVQGAFSSQDTAMFIPSTGSSSTLCFNRAGLPGTASTLSGMFVFHTKNDNPNDTLCLAVNAAGHMNILANGQGGCT